MSEAPERIWAWWDDTYDVGLLNKHGDKRYTPNDAKEYVRADRIEELEAKLAKADKLASEFKNCLEVLTKEDGYVCCSGHQCGCYGASLHAQAIYYANEAIDDYHKTTGGKNEQ